MLHLPLKLCHSALLTEGREGVQEPLILATVICEQPHISNLLLIKIHLRSGYIIRPFTQKYFCLLMIVSIFLYCEHLTGSSLPYSLLRLSRAVVLVHGCHIQTRSLMPRSVATTTPQAMGQPSFLSPTRLPLSLKLLLLLQALPIMSASPIPAPSPGLCGGLYDCTSTENSLLTHFARLPDISTCRALCLEDARCQHFTFNYQPAEESLYPGACFLLTSCTSKRPGASQWVSEARDCAVLPAPPTLPRHFRDLVVLVRTQ